MPTPIHKRRVVYCKDSIWDYIRMKAKEQSKSPSEIVRNLIEEKIKYKF